MPLPFQEQIKNALREPYKEFFEKLERTAVESVAKGEEYFQFLIPQDYKDSDQFWDVLKHSKIKQMFKVGITDYSDYMTLTLKDQEDWF